MGLNNNILSLSSSASPLTSVQSQVDGLVGSFTEQATDWRSLAAMMAGGMTYRLGRVGAMAAGTGRIASLGIGLGAEVTAFEMTNRSLSSLTGETHGNSNLWKWEGQGGIRQGLLSSLITFGSLKGAGRLAQGENLVVQHLLQDTGMVLGHQVSGAFGITDRPQGTLVEQFLHAEATNLQLGAGMALAHSFAPGIQGLERGLDLSIRSEEVGAKERLFLQNGLQPALTMAGAPSRSEEGRGSFILAMASNNGNGEGEGNGRRGLPSLQGPRALSRGEPTIPALVLWDPYRIEGMPEDALRVKIDGNPQNLTERIFTEICRNLNEENPRPMVIGLEIERARDFKTNELERSLKTFLENRHREKPIPPGLPIALAIPSKSAAIIIQNEGGVLRMQRTEFDPSGTLTYDDDVPDESAEASAEQARLTFPGVPVAATVMQIFEAFKTELEKKDALVQYQGSLWSETTARTFAKWFRTGAHQLAKGHTATILIPRMEQKVVFSRSGPEVEWKIESLGDSTREGERPASDRPRLPSPPPPSTSGGERPGRRTPPAPPGAAESTTGRERALVVSDPIHLISRVTNHLQETEGQGFDLIYTGERKLSPSEVEPMMAALVGMKEGQSVQIHQTRLQEVLELRKEGGLVALSPSSPSWAQATFATHSVSDWGELFQRLVHFMPPHRTEIRNPQMIYRGKAWAMPSVFETLVDFLSDHPIAAAQIVTIKQGRGESEIQIQRLGDRILARIQSGTEVTQEFLLVPDSKTGRLVASPSQGGRSYVYQSLEDYHQEAAELVKKGLGKRNIGTITGRPVDTSFPVETLIQSPIYRGSLLAEIAKEALGNRDLPRYRDQWLTVHRFIEKAYSFLDLETVVAYQKHIDQRDDYRSAVQGFNDKTSDPQERLTALEEMPVDLPGAALIPQWFSLRDTMVRQINENGRSVNETHVFLRDPERMGEAFGSTFNNRMGLLYSYEDFLSHRNPPQTLNDLLEGKNLDADSLEIKKQIVDLFEELPDTLRILTSGRGAFYRNFLQAALYSKQADMKKAYLGFSEAFSRLSPLVMGRYSLRKIPTLEDLEALLQPSSR